VEFTERIQHAMAGPHAEAGNPILIRQSNNFVQAVQNLGFLFPKLFPYGTGLCTTKRPVNVSEEAYLEHLLDLVDSPFAKNSSFLAVVFDTKNKRAGFRAAKMLMDKSSSLAEVSNVSVEQMAYFVDHVKSLRLAREARGVPPQLDPAKCGMARELMK
jgi:hypothetical protein